MKKRLENALQRIPLPNGLDKAAEEGIMRAKSERTGINMTRSVKVIAGLAAALAICCTTVVGAAIAGGHFENLKDKRGAIVGQQYVDGTDYFDVSLSYSKNENQLKVEAALNENGEKEFVGGFDSIRAAEFNLMNDNGEVVATSNEDGSIDFDFPEGAFLEISEDGALTITMNGENGLENYRVFVNKLIGSKKGDQDLEIFGNWVADTTFTFVESGADTEDSEATISRVEVDSDGNVIYYNEAGEQIDPPLNSVDFPMNSSSTFDGKNLDSSFGMLDISDEEEIKKSITVFTE